MPSRGSLVLEVLEVLEIGPAGMLPHSRGWPHIQEYVENTNWTQWVIQKRCHDGREVEIDLEGVER